MWMWWNSLRVLMGVVSSHWAWAARARAERSRAWSVLMAWSKMARPGSTRGDAIGSARGRERRAGWSGRIPARCVVHPGGGTASFLHHTQCLHALAITDAHHIEARHQRGDVHAGGGELR